MVYCHWCGEDRMKLERVWVENGYKELHQEPMCRVCREKALTVVVAERVDYLRFCLRRQEEERRKDLNVLWSNIRGGKLG